MANTAISRTISTSPQSLQNVIYFMLNADKFHEYELFQGQLTMFWNTKLNFLEGRVRAVVRTKHIVQPGKPPRNDPQENVAFPLGS